MLGITYSRIDSWVRTDLISSEQAGRSRLIMALCATVGVAGVGLVLLSTGRYGAGLSQDSVDYVAAARNLLAGNGYRTHAGEPFIHWGPLLPTLLAALGWLGIDLWQAGRWLNALSFGLIVFLSGSLYRRMLRSATLVVIGVLASLGYPLLFVATHIWSEGLFCLFVLWFILRLMTVIERPNWANWAWLVAAAALACLQRYFGAVTVAVGSLVLVLYWREPAGGLLGLRAIEKRMGRAGLFAAVALAPVAAWIVRNYHLTGSWSGAWGSTDSVMLEVHLQRVYDTMAGWFLSIVAPAVIVAVGVAMGAAVVWMARPLIQDIPRLARAGDPDRAARLTADTSMVPCERDRWAMAMVATVVWVYLVALLHSALSKNLSPIDNRFLAPIYVPVMGLVLDLVDRFLRWAASRPRRGTRWVHGAVIALTAVTLLVPLGRTYAYVQSARENGVPGFSDRTWAKSSITKWLRHNPLDGSLYTNDGWPLSLVVGRNVNWVSRGVESVGPFLEAQKGRAEPCYVIWYYRAWRRPREVLDALVASGRLTLVKKSSDGVVYRVEP
jgi:hypothetical protein